MNTERASPRYTDIDIWEPSDIAEAMIEGQFTAVAAVRAARNALVASLLLPLPKDFAPNTVTMKVGFRLDDDE